MNAVDLPRRKGAGSGGHRVPRLDHLNRRNDATERVGKEGRERPTGNRSVDDRLVVPRVGVVRDPRRRRVDRRIESEAVVRLAIRGRSSRGASRVEHLSPEGDD